MIVFLWLCALAVIATVFGRFGAARVGANPYSRRIARHYLWLTVILAAFIVALIALAFSAAGWAWAAWSSLSAVLCASVTAARLSPDTPPRRTFERLALGAMSAVAAIAVITTFGIFLTLIFESLRFFERIPLTDFLFGVSWSPQTAIRADQVASEGAFGVLPLITGTLLITGIAILIAGPIGLMAAIYLETYAAAKTRDVLKLVLELLAGVPTVVYGFFALLFIGPGISRLASAIAAAFGHDIDVSTQNALAAGIVMGVMIIPFVSSLSDDVISAIPSSLPEGSYALGATKSETILHVLLPAAGPGLIGAFLLAISRAIGETMIVVMAASRSANMTFDPLERVSTMTVQIVALLTGDQEFDSAKTLAAFALGLVLFITTLTLNVVALFTVKQFKLRYE